LVPLDLRYTESPDVVALRGTVLEPNGLIRVLECMRQTHPQLARAIARDPEPFLITLGLPVVRDGAVFRPIRNAPPEVDSEGAVHVARLTRLGYRREDVLRAWVECGGNVEQVEERLRR
jgi:hypothetical protein